MNLVRILLLFAFAAIATQPARADDAETCRKQVFGNYCLGGDVSALSLTAVDGLENTFTDSNGESHTLLEVDDSTLLAVERRVEPGGWREYDRWRKRLERVYRSGVDSSTFPRYAASRSSKLNA
ncbi:MAG: hypothetical protein AAF499_15030, partial [Pseudomonadota bacterium]